MERMAVHPLGLLRARDTLPQCWTSAIPGLMAVSLGYRHDLHRGVSVSVVVSRCGKRRRWDSNPRYRDAVHRFSRPALSTTQAPLPIGGRLARAQRASGADSEEVGESTIPSLRNRRRSWKNSVRISPHSAAMTPAVISGR
jgi:hypothetical protein